MGFFSTIGRIIIVILNIIFVFVSLLMVVVGVILKFFADNAFVKDLQDELKAALKSLSASTGYPSAEDIEKLNLNEVFGTVSICLIVIGAFLLGVSFFGCCGACYKVQILLILYAATIGILLLAQIIFLILLYASPAVKDLVKSQLKDSLNKYRGYNAVNVESLLWNAAMIEFKCCGVNDYTDFTNHAPNWDSSITFGNVGNINLKTPLACCVQSNLTTDDASCATSPTSSTNYQNTGCFQAIWDKAFDSPIMLAIVLTITFAVQLLLIFFAVMMYRANKKNKVGTKV